MRLAPTAVVFAALMGWTLSPVAAPGQAFQPDGKPLEQKGLVVRQAPQLFGGVSPGLGPGSLGAIRCVGAKPPVPAVLCKNARRHAALSVVRRPLGETELISFPRGGRERAGREVLRGTQGASLSGRSMAWPGARAAGANHISKGGKGLGRWAGLVGTNGVSWHEVCVTLHTNQSKRLASRQTV